MVYSWDAHEPKCYRLYIDEKKSLEEIMDIMRIEDNFTPRYACLAVLYLLRRKERVESIETSKVDFVDRRTTYLNVPTSPL